MAGHQPFGGVSTRGGALAPGPVHPRGLGGGRRLKEHDIEDNMSRYLVPVARGLGMGT